jgi:hypothetical protein
MKEKEKGKKIVCPKCNNEGSLILRQTKTKGKTYFYYAVAHSMATKLSESGKRVHKIKWCYLDKKVISELQARGIVTQNPHNVTQICVTEKTQETNCLPKAMVDGAGFEPASSAMPTLRSYQTDLPAHILRNLPF